MNEVHCNGCDGWRCDGLEDYAGFARLSDEDIAALLQWIEAQCGIVPGATLVSDDEDAPACTRLYEALSLLKQSRDLDQRYVPVAGPPAMMAITGARALGHFCVMCNQRDATAWGQSRVSGAFLGVCADCMATHPGLLREGEAMPWVRPALIPCPALPPVPPVFPRVTTIPKTGMLQPLVLGDVLPLDEQGTWRVVGEDAHVYECELVG